MFSWSSYRKFCDGLEPTRPYWHSSLSSRMKPAAILFACSSPVFNNALFYHSLPSPPSLLSILSHLLYLPHKPSLHAHPTPSSLQPRAPSPTSPDEFPMNVKQAYKAFAAVPRSLAVLEPPQVGRDAQTTLRSLQEKHAVLIGWCHPAPSWLELAVLSGTCTMLGGLVTCCEVWNALISFFYPTATISHPGVNPFLSVCAHVLIFIHSFIYIFMSLKSCLFCIFAFLLHLRLFPLFTNNLWSSTGPLWCKEQFPHKTVNSRGE